MTCLGNVELLWKLKGSRPITAIDRDSFQNLMWLMKVFAVSTWLSSVLFKIISNREWISQTFPTHETKMKKFDYFDSLLS